MEGNHAASAMLRKDQAYAETLKKVSVAEAALGIASFSEFHRSEPMWAQYAGNFGGLCVAYNLNRLIAELGTGEIRADGVQREGAGAAEGDEDG
jgi:hypothetical protein